MPSIRIFLFTCLSVCAICAADQCGSVKARGANKSQQQEIVKFHNYLRNLVKNGQVPGQPKGKNFKIMNWDSSLAKEAQKIANTCVFAHVAVKDSRFFHVGQNLYYRGTTGHFPNANWTEAIDSWFAEHKDFRYPDKANGVVGHYTQVIWADSAFIGCGFVRYVPSKSSDGKTWENEFYVCNYGPGGNIVGRAPYQLA